MISLISFVGIYSDVHLGGEGGSERPSTDLAQH